MIFGCMVFFLCLSYFLVLLRLRCNSAEQYRFTNEKAARVLVSSKITRTLVEYMYTQW